MADTRSADLDANIAVVRRAYAAFQAGDIPAVLACFAPDAWFEGLGTPHLPCAGRWEGHQGLVRFFTAIGDMAEVRGFTPQSITTVADGRVLGEGTEEMRFRASGQETRTRWLHLFMVRDGLIRSGTEWNESAVMAAAFRGD